MIEKNVKIEIELSEEHLQDITGGCAQCLADLTRVRRIQGVATSLMQAAEEKAQLGQLTGRSGALALHRRAQGSLQRTQTLLDGVRTRHQEPVPDLNLPPPQ